MKEMCLPFLTLWIIQPGRPKLAFLKQKRDTGIEDFCRGYGAGVLKQLSPIKMVYELP
jgi:hypothetical protein